MNATAEAEARALTAIPQTNNPFQLQALTPEQMAVLQRMMAQVTAPLNVENDLYKSEV